MTVDMLLLSFNSMRFSKGGFVHIVRIMIQVPRSMKAKLDAERKRGTSASGLIRHLLEQHFKGKKAA